MPYQNSTDHDLLVVAITKLDNLQNAIEKIETRLDAKADIAAVRDLAERAAQLEKRVYMICGGLILAQAAAHFLRF